MIIVVLLGSFLSALLLPFRRFIRKWLYIVVLWLVAWIHHSYLLAVDLEVWIICFVKRCWGLLRRKEFNECEVLKCPSQLVLYLPDVLYWRIGLKNLQQCALVHFTDDRSPNHKTAVLRWLLPQRTWRWLSTIAESACKCLICFTSIASISSGKIFIVALIAIPIVSHIQVNFPKRKILYFYFFVPESSLAFQMLHHGHRSFNTRILQKQFVPLDLHFIRNARADTNTQVSKHGF